MNDEQAITKLLTEKRLSPYQTGFLHGLRGHRPIGRQVEILERLIFQYGLDEDEFEKKENRNEKPTETAKEHPGPGRDDK
jgi:hypothetical protein